MPQIEIKNLHKSFGPKVVLDGVDLNVTNAESVVVIGGSGTGKSVLIKSILGIVTPDSGQILIDGKDATKFSTRAVRCLKRCGNANIS